MLAVLGLIFCITDFISWTLFWLLELLKRFFYYELVLYTLRIKVWPYPVYNFKNKTAILLLITHTDDICVYFGPLTLKLIQSQNCELHVMCLLDNSNDKYSQIERTKKKEELLKSCKILGILEGNVILITREFTSKIPYLKDTLTSCAKCVLNYVEGIRAKFIFTFDKGGVNGNPNHVFLFRILSYMCMRRIVPSNCRVFKLQTTSILRRYSFITDLFITEWKSNYIFIASPAETRKIAQALQIYPFHMKWYNRLLVFLSRFSYVNSVEEMYVFKNHSLARMEISKNRSRKLRMLRKLQF